MVLTDDPPLYRDLMQLKPEELTPNAWAVKAGVSRTVWTDMRRHGNPSRRTLEKLLEAAGSSLAEFESLRVGKAPRPPATAPGQLGDFRSSSWRAAPLPTVPLFASRLAGEWPGSDRSIELAEIDFGEVTGQVAPPASLAADRDAYAVTVVGDSMWPRFRPGRRLLVSPAAPIVVGDDVLVRLVGEESGKANVLIKELVRRTAGFVELRQFSPDATFKVEASAIAAMHKVVGEAI
jgi:SOS-response transcriptional repressor LexA